MPWERVRREFLGTAWHPRLKALGLGIVLGELAGANVVGIPHPPIQITVFWACVGAVGAIVSSYWRAGYALSLFVAAITTLGANGGGSVGATWMLIYALESPQWIVILSLPGALVLGTLGHAIGEYLAKESKDREYSAIGTVLLGNVLVPRGFAIVHFGIVVVLAVAIGLGELQAVSLSTPLGVLVIVVALSLPLWVGAIGGGLAHSMVFVLVPVSVVAVLEAFVSVPEDPFPIAIAQIYWNLGLAALAGSIAFIAGRAVRYFWWLASRFLSGSDGRSLPDSSSIRMAIDRVPTRGSIRLATAVIVVVLLFGVPTTPILEPIPPSDVEDATVSLQTGPCLGTCPIYSATICGNGTVHFVGREYTNVLGYDRFEISQNRVGSIVDTVYQTDYFRLRDRYSVAVTDLPSTTVTVSISGREKSVFEYGNAGPDRLDRVQREINDLLGPRNGHNGSNRRPDGTDYSERGC